MRHFPLSRLVAAALAVALVVTAPGLGSYAAAQAIVRPAPGVPVGIVTTGGALRSPVSAPLSNPFGSSILPAPSALPSAASLTPNVQVPGRIAAVSAQASVPGAAMTAAGASIHKEAAAPRGISGAAVAFNPGSVTVERITALAPLAAAPLTAAVKTAAAPSVSFSSLRRLFDGGIGRLELGDVAARPSAARAPALNAARPQEPSEPGGIPTPAPAPAAASNRPYALSLALAGVGSAAAYLLIPLVVPLLAGVLPFTLAPLALKSAVVTGGFALGASLGEWDLWRSLPGEVASGAVNAGRTAFRFWARFGLVFRAVLTASSIDEAMKADLPAAFWKYPLLALPFVGIGYVFTPALFFFGALFKSVEIPVRAAFRGVKRIVVGLLPFMADVFAFINRAIRAFIPAMGALLYRGARMAALTAVGGAVVLAAPVWNALVKGPYAIDKTWDEAKLSKVPALIAMALGRILGFVAAVALGAVGGLLGFTVGLPLTITDAVLGFAAKVAPQGAAARADARWRAALKKAAELEAFHRVDAAAHRGDGSSLPRALARLVSAAPGAVYALPFSVAGSLGLWVVGLAAAFGYERAAAPRVEAPRREEKEAAEVPVEKIEGSPWVPLLLTFVGAAAGILYAPLLLGLVPMAWLSWAIMSPIYLTGAGALLGAGMGLALSQPKAWLGIFSTALFSAKAGAADAFRLWARLGLAARVNITGKAVDETLFAEAPASLLRYPILAWPAVAAGYIAAAAGFIIGGTAAALGVPVNAAWRGLVILVSSGLIRRIVRAVKNVLIHGIPFVFGFVFGTISGGVRTAFAAAAVLALPAWRSVVASDDENPYRYTGLTGLVLKRAVQFLGVVAGLGAGIIGLAVGAVYFLPAALTNGLRLGLKWADADGKLLGWLTRWEKNLENDMTEASGQRLARVVAPGTKDEAGLWQGTVRAANAATYAMTSVLWGLPVALALYARAARNASVSDKPVREGWEETTGESAERARPSGVLETIVREAGDGWNGSLGFWKEAGKAFGYAVARDEASVITMPYLLPGVVLGAGGVLTGAVAGAVEVPGRSFLDGVKRLALKLLPFLERVWNLALRIAKRVFPFIGGAIAGAVVGVVGSAAFGALLLGRPWFKYVAAEEYDTSSTGRFLGVAALRIVAALAGIVFGTVGLAFGLLAALPYSITTMVALAFEWGGIGGKSELFFQHWTRGALRAEMKRLSKLTDSFDFSDKKDDGELKPVDGWVRLGMVAAATLAATLAATIAGYVSYVRSIGAAYRAARDGEPVPNWGGAGGGKVEDGVSHGSKIGRKAGVWLGELAGLVGAGMIALGFLTAPTWLGSLGSGLGLLGLVVLSGPAGWLAGLIAGSLIGALIGMLMWLDAAIKSA